MWKISELSTKTTPVWADIVTGLDSEDTNPDTKNKNFLLSALSTFVFWDKSTTNLSEWTNLYYTEDRVTANTTVVWLGTTKADKTNVLELDNTTAFTPDADYEPATKKYVDDNSGGSNLVSDFVCGESITAWEPVYIDSSNNKIYKTDATDLDKIWFIWFTQSTWVLDDTISVVTGWIDTNQTGLTPGELYYLSDTPWDVSLTPWTNFANIWRATSATSLLLNTNNYKTKVVNIQATRTTTSASWTVTYTHNMWVIPSIIKAFAWYGIASNGKAISQWTWINDWTNTNKCTYNPAASDTMSVSSTYAIIQQESDNDWQSGIINNVTTTSFDVVWTYNSAPYSAFIWLDFNLYY